MKTPFEKNLILRMEAHFEMYFENENMFLEMWQVTSFGFKIIPDKLFHLPWVNQTQLLRKDYFPFFFARTPPQSSLRLHLVDWLDSI